ncbi:MAG: PTS sugar transporter subunit IIA [Sphaerochaetaceae bacterium]|nr:PTS sugar transporter subunit IIA [Sphaerochaetaceae bacterium]MDX9810468.1 PTS sugar transporter subunit IIA [Sphaerochaetaceae bacterium]NLV84070.1 PTS sugar transporter subunit IIA [Spirochaetales bacterium]
MDRHLDGFESVMCRLTATTKREAIIETIDSCPVFSIMPDIQKFKRAVLRREEIETTGIGHGIAVAHGKVRNLSYTLVGLGISDSGIEYNAKDGNPVHFLFVIASSPSRQLEYIKTISNILRTLRNEEVRQELQKLKRNCSWSDVHSPECQSLLQMLITQHFAWMNQPGRQNSTENDQTQ